MMKRVTAAALFISGLLLSHHCFPQLVADAGSDTAYCDYKWEQASIGGNPTAHGGTEPYTYAWSAEYRYGGQVYTASSLLEDTTAANPVFSTWFTDSARFHLTVTDAHQATAADSVWVRFSQYIICTGDCFHWIYPGDSVQLGHCITGGIPPYRYAWTPGESLSDSTAEKPWAKPLAHTEYELLYTDAIGCEAHWSCIVTVAQSGVQTDHAGREKLQLHPNPSSGIIYLTLPHPPQKYCLLKFYSVEGRLVKEVRISDPAQTVDLSNLGQGLYFYKWIEGDKVAGSGRILVELH